ncbi:MAG: hypothetical protein KA732_19670 [Providencia sp.]|uniref:hypothetical protein n=1 Tax=Providencia sp. TaxID=589 RepID=UPI001B4BBDFE|nr:hypothetical protein [Providencia sp.]
MKRYEKEDSGFILISNETSKVEKFFFENKIPQEGTVLELLVVKKQTVGGICELVIKFKCKN